MFWGLVVVVCLYFGWCDVVDISELLPDPIVLDDLFGTFNAVLVWLAVPLLVMLGVAIMPSVVSALSGLIAGLSGGVARRRAPFGEDEAPSYERAYVRGFNNRVDRHFYDVGADDADDALDDFEDTL